MSGEGDLERTELEAVLETRRELGPSYDAALVDSFADRVEVAVSQRVHDELARRDAAGRVQASAGPRQLALGIVSAAVGIPVTAISLAVPENGVVGLVAMMIGWTGLAGVNIAHALQSRRQDPRLTGHP